jgi:hypothetical protein
MPLIKVYNINSDLYGLKGHSIFKSVRPFIFGYVAIPKLYERQPFGITYRQLQPKLFLPAGPSATKHGPNNIYIYNFKKEKELRKENEIERGKEFL